MTAPNDDGPGRNQGQSSKNTINQSNSTTTDLAVHVVDGEIVEPADLDADAARELTERLCSIVTKACGLQDRAAILNDKITVLEDKMYVLTDQAAELREAAYYLMEDAYNGRAWLALGYETWDAYCQAELAELRLVRLTAEQRREVVADLREAAMSTRAIASGLGVHHATIARDVAALPVADATPEPVTGLDGKSYPPREPKVLPRIDRGPAYLRSNVMSAARDCLSHLRELNGVNCLANDVGDAEKAGDDDWKAVAEGDLEDLQHYLDRLLQVLRDPSAAERGRTDRYERDDMQKLRVVRDVFVDGAQ